MAERSKAHAWKACRLQKGLKGSNPFLSAIVWRNKFALGAYLLSGYKGKVAEAPNAKG